MNQLIGAMLAAAGSLIIVSLTIIIKTLFAMRRDVMSFSGTVQALAESLLFLLKATRNQNAALREIGANGATEKADACIDEAESVLNRYLVAATKGATK
jgi:hypothetical protein